MHTMASFALLLAIALAQGCGGNDEGQPDATSFVGVPWLLSSGVDAEGWETAAPTATFDDGTVGGSTECNRYAASYTVDGAALELGAVASTLRAAQP